MGEAKALPAARALRPARQGYGDFRPRRRGSRRDGCVVGEVPKKGTAAGSKRCAHHAMNLEPRCEGMMMALSHVAIMLYYLH
jgi:hypothetical protein